MAKISLENSVDGIEILQSSFEDYVLDLNSEITSGNLGSFKSKFKSVLKFSIDNNRFIQFHRIFKKIFKYTQIPKEAGMCLDKYEELYFFAGTKHNYTIHDLGTYLSRCSSLFYLRKRNIAILKLYFAEVKNIARSSNISFTHTNNKILLLSLYSLILQDSISREELKDFYLSTKNLIGGKTAVAIASYLGINVQSVTPSDEERQCNIERYDIEVPDIVLSSKEINNDLFIILKKTNHLNLAEKIIFFLMANQPTFALRIIDENIVDEKEKSILLLYMIDATVQLNRLDTLHSLFLTKNLITGSMKDKRLYFYLLKKLLVKNKKFKESRSVGKLLRNL